ncbi:MAG: hypothetical protein COU08_02470 [Candidatus Harrisonbacteria bacterium CG10_big_fil_rev_8_21_14_0_10_42_17]|uniref:Glycosyltransferase family 1 protein n=1 Tax=Candidatus Harrisonbacteria bacterium CG10_big_fil_rev_8_21_14_0_10_42_17 TaxID=1974584 RepID=A0A2M6WI30_9BACT|nr:MAG: hypothetical protein COU08_02470 [Candidatus Harrisonbacteria bacterium CG10_big_fil_rev_8_21_14_0_10_42_17]
MKKRTIAFIVNELGLGGVQRLVVDMANAFNKTQWEVIIITLSQGKETNFYRDQLDFTVHVEQFKFNNARDIKSWFKLYRYLKQKRCDVVFTQLFMADFMGRTAAWCARVPVIATAIQNIIPSLPKKFIAIDRILRNITTICFAPTEEIAQYAHDVIKFKKEKIVRINSNAVVKRRFTENVDEKKLRHELGISKSEKMIIAVGRLMEQKGHKVLIEAAPLVITEHPEVRIVIVGSGKLEAELKNFAEKLQLQDRILFTGARSDIPNLLRTADVFAFPSIWEGQGVILFEAIFAEIPIAASNVGGIPEVIEHERTGLLSEPGDHKALAENINRLLNDHKLAAMLTKNALERFGDRTMENTVEKLEEIFENLLKKRNHKN